MTRLTIDNLSPETERRLRQLAERTGKSVSEVVKELLDEMAATSCGATTQGRPGAVSSVDQRASGRNWNAFGEPSDERCRRFAALREGVSDGDLAGFDEALAEMRQVNPEDWK